MVVTQVVSGIAGAGLGASYLVRNETKDRGNNAKQVFKDERKEKHLEAA